MRISLILIVAVLLLASCKQKNESALEGKENLEFIQEIKLNDSTATVIDSLNNEIKVSAKKLDKLLNDIN